VNVMANLTELDLATIVGGQQATPAAPPSTSTTGPTVPDDPEEELRRHERWLDKPISWTECTGGFWHGCTNRDRDR